MHAHEIYAYVIGWQPPSPPLYIEKAPCPLFYFNTPSLAPGFLKTHVVAKNK